MASTHICKNCGFQGQPKTTTNGSTLVEIVLWLSFIIPGIIYSVWRLASRFDACPKCKAPDMVSLDTPLGQKLQQEFNT